MKSKETADQSEVAEHFKDFTRKIMAVPKKEIDEQPALYADGG